MGGLNILGHELESVSYVRLEFLKIGVEVTTTFNYPTQETPKDHGYPLFRRKRHECHGLKRFLVAIFTYVFWGRCYDHNFLRFSPFFGEKIGFFSKTYVMIKFLHNLALF
jgi:hypothetical protein